MQKSTGAQTWGNYEEKIIADAEVAIMKHAQSRHIMKFIESFAFETDLCIVMKYYSGGNLRKQMETLKKMTFKERKRRCYKPFYQMLSALAYLHSLGIVHCDLKPENGFFDIEGNVRTGDYGLTQQKVILEYMPYI
ncbi:MAG: hypothetical protein EZS28_042720 [Streblomastix strix]|uniref:non-specific serine/threonine protein kinase n=1 Tax=Streblomastix strix TaxID=222440 RepID=A0A5J4TV21_9EUKA|nr:MAG: hypothetical protein EZS28_042720 [Streblomastix strix]